MTASRAVRWLLWLAWGAVLLFGAALMPSCESAFSALALNCSSSMCVAIVVPPLVGALCDGAVPKRRAVLCALALGGVVATVCRLLLSLGSLGAPATVPSRCAELVSLTAWSLLGPAWVFPDSSRDGSSRCLALHQTGLYLLLVIAYYAQLAPRPPAPWSASSRLLYGMAGFAVLLIWWALGLRLRSALLPPPSSGPRYREDATLTALSPLTEREREVFTAVQRGEKQVDIARRLGLSPSTVSTYRRRACEKLGLDPSTPLRAPISPAASPNEDVPPEHRVSPAALLAPSLLLALGLLCSWVGDGASTLLLQALGAAVLVGALVRSLTSPPASSTEGGEGGLGLSSAATVLVTALLLGLSARYLLSLGEPQPLAVISCALFAAAALLLHHRRQCLALPSLGRQARPLAASVLSCALIVGASPHSAEGTVAVAGALSLSPSLVLSCSLLVATLATPFALRLLCVGKDEIDRPSGLLDSARPLLYLQGRGLSETDARILVEIARGRSASEICRALSVSEGSVNTARFKAYQTLGIHSKRELVDLLLVETGSVLRPPSMDGESEASF